MVKSWFKFVTPSPTKSEARNPKSETNPKSESGVRVVATVHLLPHIFYLNYGPVSVKDGW
jgi:hypothetical protein